MGLTSQIEKAAEASQTKNWDSKRQWVSKSVSFPSIRHDRDTSFFPFLYFRLTPFHADVFRAVSVCFPSLVQEPWSSQVSGYRASLLLLVRYRRHGPGRVSLSTSQKLESGPVAGHVG